MWKKRKNRNYERVCVVIDFNSQNFFGTCHVCGQIIYCGWATDYKFWVGHYRLQIQLPYSFGIDLSSYEYENEAFLLLISSFFACWLVHHRMYMNRSPLPCSQFILRIACQVFPTFFDFLFMPNMILRFPIVQLFRISSHPPIFSMLSLNHLVMNSVASVSLFGRYFYFLEFCVGSCVLCVLSLLFFSHSLTFLG